MAQRTLVVLFVVVFSALARAQNTTWYVDVNGTPPGTGTQADPYTSIQYAISRMTTVQGDEIVVLPGTYFENIDFLGKAILLSSQSGPASTIIDAGQNGSAVRFVGGPGPQAAFGGFTIQNGLAPGPHPRKGGGVYISGASPTLAQLVITGNEADSGAGIYLENSLATIIECTIHANLYTDSISEGYRGGGIHATCDSSPQVEDCAIYAHHAGNRGGGIYGAGTYVDCVIEDNFAFQGAGAYSNGCDLHLVGCTIRDNKTYAITGECSAGGGVFGPALLESCTLTDNLACADGGGAMLATLVGCTIASNTVVSYKSLSGRGGGAADCTLTDCNVYGNRATYQPGWGNAPRGGGIAGGAASYCWIRDNVAESEAPHVFPARGGGLIDCDARRCLVYRNRATQGAGATGGSLRFCTLYENTATVNGGGVFVAFGAMSVVNSILWRDLPQEIAVGSGSIAVTYSDVRGGYAGTGNIDADPRFWMPVLPDLRLKPGSPCINTASPTAPLDPDGSRADMGALPLAPEHCAPPAAYCVAKTNSLGCIPSIGYSGTPTATGADDFFVTAANVRNQKTGILLWGPAPAATPFHGGTLCVGGGFHRTPPQSSGGSGSGADCTGSYSFHFSQAYRLAQGLGWASTVYAQYWSRDPGFPPPDNIGLTNALEFTVCP